MTYIAVGSGEARRGFAFVYRSEDLKHWERVGELCEAETTRKRICGNARNFIRFPDGSATLLVSLMKRRTYSPWTANTMTTSWTRVPLRPV